MDERDSVQGCGADADHRVVAPPARGRRAAPHDLAPTPTRSSRCVPALARASRRARRTRDALPAHARSFPIECVVRGYLSGSAWKEYRAHGTLAGESLAAGPRESERFDPPLFSPATKAESGHDENITIARMVATSLGARRGARARAAEPARVRARPRRSRRERGIIIADTKFEFGRDARRPDHAHRRSAHARQLALLAGRSVCARVASQPSFDKQPLRDYLDAERRAGRWNGEAPPPPLAGRGRRRRRARATSTRSGASPATQLDVTELDVNFAREGLRFIVIAALIAVGAFAVALDAPLVAALAARRSRSRSSRSGSPTSSATRSAPASAATRLVIAPADGKVVHDHRGRRAAPS